MSSRWKNAWLWLAFAGLPAIAAGQITSQTVSFQNGANGYTGTFDIRINHTDVPALIGANATYCYIDSRKADGTETDMWGLIRFDHIIGYEPGQIPPGATILSAQLQLTTATPDAAVSPGPMGVARLLKPFDENTHWSSFGPEGPDLIGGDFDRPEGGFMDMNTHAGPEFADVTSIVQAWANGAENHGFLIIGATSDGWAICTTGNGTVNRRPKLIVEYAQLRSRAVTFQQDLGGYSGASMLRLSQGDLKFPEKTEFGASLTTGAYLDTDDGLDAAWTPPNPGHLVYALIRFDDVFGPGPEQVAPNATILKAFLTLTTLKRTSGSGGSYEARSRGPYHIHRLLVDVDWTGSDPSKPFLWSDFLNSDGPTEADGEIGPVVSSVYGMAWDARASFDVTDVVKGWQSGESNYGFVVIPGTADGWKIDWLGSPGERRPRLTVLVSSARADISGDGYVDETDMDLFEACAATSGPAIPHAGGCAAADLDGDTDVDQSDYGILQACFSGSQIASSDCR